jgi:hypothetical protein
MRAGSTKTPSGKLQIPADWVAETSKHSGTGFAIIGTPFSKPTEAKSPPPKPMTQAEIAAAPKESPLDKLDQEGRELVQQVLQNYPGLTPVEANQMLTEFGGL